MARRKARSGGSGNSRYPVPFPMAIAKKNGRKILVDDIPYRWHVADDDDGVYVGSTRSLTILSENKSFHITYHLDQTGTHRFVVIKGRIFGGTGEFGKNWQRVVCPDWNEKGAVTPYIVQQIILWALADKDIVLTNYLGEIPVQR
jgi:hypothetical protein